MINPMRTCSTTLPNKLLLQWVDIQSLKLDWPHHM
jgi:hypothetical protein